MCATINLADALFNSELRLPPAVTQRNCSPHLQQEDESVSISVYIFPNSKKTATSYARKKEKTISTEQSYSESGVFCCSELFYRLIQKAHKKCSLSCLSVVITIVMFLFLFFNYSENKRKLGVKLPKNYNSSTFCKI